VGLAEVFGQIGRGGEGQGAGEAGVGFLPVRGGVEGHQGQGQGVGDIGSAGGVSAAWRRKGRALSGSLQPSLLSKFNSMKKKINWLHKYALHVYDLHRQEITFGKGRH
jgi:hypothetical protein